MSERTKTNECYTCVNRRTIPGDCHTQCANPDSEMTGNGHGIKSGWFLYPLNFDPVWKTKDCDNYQSENEKPQTSGDE